MGQVRRLASADGFEFDAWHAAPQDARRGGLVILHAIWGVTPHIRELCDQWAEAGYESLAPSLFDRFERGFAEHNTDPARLKTQDGYARATDWGRTTMPDVQAAIDALEPPVFLMGFCFGGTAAWIAAAECTGLSAVASFYGGQIYLNLDLEPACPTILHLGKRDELIPPDEVEKIRAAHPDLPVFMYDAGHAFVAPNGYDADAERLSRLRTLAHFSRNGGGRGEGA